jgi:hypothetical protein
MKLCHAAALALVGWYLMVPPMHACDGCVIGKPNFDACLQTCLNQFKERSNWSVRGSYDSAAECSNAKMRMLNLEATVGKDQSIFENILNAECIATDDPRLKVN